MIRLIQPRTAYAMNGVFSTFFSRRMLTLLALGLSSGLPLVLVTKLLTLWLSAAGLDVKQIGLIGLVTLPYSLKFIWSPLVDRYVPPLLGRRRGWMLASQIVLILGILM